MRIRGSLSKGLLIALALSMIPEAAVSAQKITPGSACKTLNQKVVYLNKTYTCTKSGKKLIWNKGVAVKKPTPENLSLSDPVLNCKIKDASNPEVGQYGGALYGGFIEKDRPIPS